MTSRVFGARGLSAHLLQALQPLLSSGNTPRILSAPLRALLQPRTLLACNGADAAPRVVSCSTVLTDASSLRMLSTSAAQQVLRGSNDSAPARPAGHPRTRSSGRGAPQQASQSRGFASGPKQQPDPPSAQQTEQEGKAYSPLLRHLMTKIQVSAQPITHWEYTCLKHHHARAPDTQPRALRHAASGESTSGHALRLPVVLQSRTDSPHPATRWGPRVSAL